MQLQGKKILLGVCGSIAAYKSALLIRLLIKEGAEVKVIMTASASDFITPLTLATLSKNPVLSKFSKDSTGVWNSHVELGLWADLFIIAPASANTIAKMANGLCDNLLTAVYLSAKCPIAIAPAMDLDMYQHPTTLNNINILKKNGNIIWEAETGELASGLIGQGRMAEPENLMLHLINLLQGDAPLKGKMALVTAGPTHEAIDPVRFISNHSTGKMGFAIAQELATAGAKVRLITGPTSLKCEIPSIDVTQVTSADDMYQQCKKYFEHSHVAVFAAAVADYRPSNPSAQKIKKAGDTINLELTKTTDIAHELGSMKKKNQFLVGFALETENESQHASDKLKAKNFDLIVLNSLNDEGAGFGYDTNKVTIIDKNNNSYKIELKSKKEVAKDIVSAIIKQIHE